MAARTAASGSVRIGLRYASPGLGSIEKRDVAAHLKLLAVFDRRQAQGVVLAVVRVEDLAAFPNLLAICFFGATDDLQPQHRLVFALIGTLVADIVLLGIFAQQFLDAAREHARVIADAHLG